MKNERLNFNIRNIYCEICAGIPKKSIFAKCGHSFCKNCILSNMACITCNILLTKNDLCENFKLNSCTKNKMFEDSNLKQNILNTDIYNFNKSVTSNLLKEDFQYINNFTTLQNSLKNDFKNKIVICDIESDKKIDQCGLDKIFMNNSFSLIKNPKINESYYEKAKICLNYKLSRRNELIDKTEKINDDQLSLINNHKNENLIPLNSISIGKKRVYKDFIKAQNNLIEEKYIKKFPTNLNITNIDSFNKERLDYMFDNIIDIFNPKDDELYERKYLIPESELLGNNNKKRKTDKI